MVGPIQDVKEAQFHELPGGLEPARIEVDQSRIAEEFKRADRSARRQKAESDDDARGQPVKAGMNREARLVGLNGVLKEHVQHRLVPENGRAIRELRAGDMRERLVVGRERRIGFEREARLHDARLRQARVSFIDIDEIGDPQTCGFAERRIHSVEIQVTLISFGEFHVTHGFERHAHQDIQVIPRRLEKHLNRRVAGNIVSRQRMRGRDKQKRQERGDGPGRDIDAGHRPEA